MKTLTLALTAALIAISAVATLPLAPCATEDQETPCYWDAGTQGNGLAHSFIVTPSGAILYTDLKG
jgi:hypothetical protein